MLLSHCVYLRTFVSFSGKILCRKILLLIEDRFFSLDKIVSWNTNKKAAPGILLGIILLQFPDKTR